MADQDPNLPPQGFPYNVIGAIGSLFRSAPPPAAAPPADAQKPDESVADFAERRQQARFGKMKDEVDGLLKRYPATGDFPDTDAYRKEVQGLRQRGFDQKEEDAIMKTFAHTHGELSGHLRSVLGRGGSEEWQAQDSPSKGGAAGARTTTEDEPMVPFEKGRDVELENKLLDNWTKSGREPSYRPGTGKRSRMWFRDEAPGFDT